MARLAPRLLATLGTDAPGPADAVLLARFAADRDAGAFELLVYRHAPLVLRVCRAVLRDHHAAEDAAQAVFLSLARQASAVRGDHLAGWLFRVSRRVAARSARRRPPPADVIDPDALPAPAPTPAPDPAEVRLLHDELARLPEAYRAPILLCYFEGLTRAEAARRLGWPPGTVDGRLARAKDRLAARLARRGLAPSLLAAAVETAPPGFAGVVAQAAVAYSAGTATGLSTSIVTLANQETRRTTMGKLAKVVGAALSLGVVAAGLGIAAVGAGPAGPLPAPAKPPEPGAPAADLPAGAVVRLGSAALRHPDLLTHLRFTADGRHLLSYGNGKLRRWDARTGAAVPDPARDVAVAFDYSMLNPDATRVVAPHADQNPFRMSVREYDLATGRHVELFPVPGRRPGGGGGGFGDFGEQWRALSPDGTLLVEGWDREAFVWDLRARSVRHHLTFPSTQTSRYQFAPDGKHLLTAAGDERAVRVWDLGTGKETGVLAWEGRGRGRGGASALAVSPDGRWVAAAVFDLPGNGAELAVWDRSGGGPPLLITLPDGFGPGGDLVFGPGGALYAVSLPPEGTGTVVTRWDVATGRRVGRWAGLAPGRYGRSVAAVSPDGRVLAVGTYQGVVRLYDTRTGDEVVRPPALATEVIGVSFDPTGGEVRTVGVDGSVATYDAATGAARTRRPPPLPLPPPGGAVPVMASTDGRWVVTYARNSDGPRPWLVVDLRDGATGARKYSWGEDGRVTGLTPVPGGTLLAGRVEIPGGMKDVRVWDTATGKAVPWFETQPPRERRYAVSHDGKTFLVVAQDRVTGYDPATGRKRFTWTLADLKVPGRQSVPDFPIGQVWAAGVSPDGKTVAVAVVSGLFFSPGSQSDSSLVLVEAETGKVVRWVRASVPLESPLVFSPDGKWVAGAWSVWEVATLREVRRFPPRPWVSAVGFSPDGKRVATGHTNGTAVVWPVAAE